MRRSKKNCYFSSVLNTILSQHWTNLAIFVSADRHFPKQNGVEVFHQFEDIEPEVYHKKRRISGTYKNVSY